MLTRTKVAVAAAFVLASASGALAQSLIGNGVPNEVYSGYGNDRGYHGYAFGPGAYAFEPQEYGVPSRHHARHHHEQHQ